jgi:hypothetical protein
MKKQRSLSRSVFSVALVTVLILSVPLVAMQFTDAVKWSVIDFIIMAILIFGTGFSYVLLTRLSSNIVHRAAVGLAIGSTFLLIWANLAVGLIGSGPNAANLMYSGIVAIVVIGILLSRFTTKGMERVMFTAAITLVLFAVIQLLAKMHEYPGSSITEIIGINTFFATLFAVSGLLFRYITLQHLPAHAKKTAQE